MTLTENEIKALKMCVNYNTRDEQFSDNFSNAGTHEFSRLFNGNMKAAGGLISSLVKKDLGYMDDEGYDIFWLSDTGIDTVFDILEKD